MLQLQGKPATVQSSEPWLRWLSLWFSGSGELVPVFPITLKHTSKGKIHSGSPIYLFSSLVTSQRAL